MVSRKLMGVWAGLDFLLLVAGAVTIALSFVWRAENLMLNLVLTPNYLTSGLILGIALVVTFAVSIAGVVQKNHVTLGLVALNYTLVLDALGIIVIGTFVWFFTLQERANFYVRWLDLTPDKRIAIQDKFSCCGYFFGNDAEIGGNFCTSTDFASGLNTSVLTNFCVTPITSYADMTLNNVFTTVYGYMAIIICLFLATLCVINKRKEDERFKKIDAKRGGRGFV
jgi:hypothetical protein